MAEAAENAHLFNEAKVNIKSKKQTKLEMPLRRRQLLRLQKRLALSRRWMKMFS